MRSWDLTSSLIDLAVATLLPAVEGQTVLTDVKGLATGSWTRAVTTSSETLGETSYALYDNKTRPISSRITNYLGGYTQTDTKLNFDGTPSYTITKHKRITSSTELTVREDFAYTSKEPQSNMLLSSVNITVLLSCP